MKLFQDLGIVSPDASIDWELTPADTFAIFESWGGSRRVRNKDERFYYFYVDDWQDQPEVRLMERGIKHARFLAKIDAPSGLIDASIAEQGKDVAVNNKSYAISEGLRQWLRENICTDSYNPALVTRLTKDAEDAAAATGLPISGKSGDTRKTLSLPLLANPAGDLEIAAMIAAGDFFDCDKNPAGRFTNCFIDNQDSLTVTDLTTGLIWQRGGYEEINTMIRMQHYCRTMNQERFADHDDWRLPTLAEAMSLLRAEKNAAGLHLPSFFSPRQTFIFCAEQRKPGGQWYVDFNLGRAYWASGSNPGGYGRLVRGSV